MPEPMVLIARQKIKDGKLEAYKENFLDVMNFINANKPNTLGFLDYVNEEGTEAVLVQIYASAEAMEQHIQGLGEIAKRSYESMDVMSFEIYGKPTEAYLAMMSNLAKAGVPVKIIPNNIGGYLRMKSDP